MNEPSLDNPLVFVRLSSNFLVGPKFSLIYSSYTGSVSIYKNRYLNVVELKMQTIIRVYPQSVLIDLLNFRIDDHDHVNLQSLDKCDDVIQSIVELVFG